MPNRWHDGLGARCRCTPLEGPQLGKERRPVAVRAGTAPEGRYWMPGCRTYRFGHRGVLIVHPRFVTDTLGVLR